MRPRFTRRRRPRRIDQPGAVTLGVSTPNGTCPALNTGITAFVGYVALEKDALSNSPWVSLVAIAGVVLSYLRYRIVRSYRDLNSAKFQVLHAIEMDLPLRPYDAEWEAVGRGKDRKRYLPFTHVEIAIPFVFLLLHAIVLIRVIPWSTLLAQATGAE